MKIYIHHYYNKSLFYNLCNNTKDREYYIENKEGSVLCKYKNLEIEFIFKQQISYEDDGYHILDYFSAYFDNINDPKIGKILQDTSFMERENQQILKIFINLLKDKPKDQKWIITCFRTEKLLHSIDSETGEMSEKFNELESLFKQLSDNHIVTDNVFLNDKIESLYPNFYYAFTNSIFQWNRNLNIRWYYEFKNVYDKLYFDYDLMYSVRNHKGFRIELLNELNKLKNKRIYLQTTDALKGNEYDIKYGSKVSEDIGFNSIYGKSDFDDISQIQNIINGLDFFCRVLPKAKMQILCESWSQNKKDYNSQYLSEKTIGLILSGIPFISTHDYPLLILEKILDVPPHPFLNQTKKYKSDAKLFAQFVNNFLQNFDENYNLCKKWSDFVLKKFIYKMENENSLLDLIMNGEFEKEPIKIKQIL